MRVHDKSAQKEPAKHEKTLRGKTIEWRSTIVSEIDNLEAKKEMCWRSKTITAHKIQNTLSKATFHDMEQFFLVPSSIKNKSLKTQKNTKQEIPNYQAEQKPTYPIDSLLEDMSKEVSAKACSFKSKVLSQPHSKHSSSKSLMLYGVEYMA